MEVHFSPEVEMRLQQVASASGKDAEQLVKETVSRMLENQARFIAGVQESIDQADHGEFVEHQEVLDRPVRQVRWTAEASDQLVAIVKRIQEDNPSTARNVAQIVIERTEDLATLPALGRLGEVEGTREPVLQRYGQPPSGFGGAFGFLGS